MEFKTGDRVRTKIGPSGEVVERLGAISYKVKFDKPVRMTFFDENGTQIKGYAATMDFTAGMLSLITPLPKPGSSKEQFEEMRRQDLDEYFDRCGARASTMYGDLF